MELDTDQSLCAGIQFCGGYFIADEKGTLNLGESRIKVKPVTI